MTDYADGAANHAPLADGRATGHPDAARQHGVRPDPDVMSNLDLVVELDAVLDDGVLDRTPVDRRVGPDLDVIADADGPDLGHLHEAVAIWREAEAVGPDHGAAVEHAPLAQAHAPVQDYVGDEAGVGADVRVLHDHRAGPHAGPRADHGARLDHGPGTHMRVA